MSQVYTQESGWLPGDFAVVRSTSIVGRFVTLLERIAGYRKRSGKRQYTHAIQGVRDGMIVEATPDGAKLRPMHYGSPAVVWSTGKLPLTSAQRVAICDAAYGYAAANGGEGVPYSFMDYLAIAAHRLHLPIPGLRDYVADTGHMICSQLVAQCQADGGHELFSDDRWPGYVAPDDLADLIDAP